MSLCSKLISNKPATCNTVSGGVAVMLIFDPHNVGFVLHTDDPDGGYFTLHQVDDIPIELYPVNFQRYEAEYTAKQSSKAGFYTKYEHQISCVSPDLSMLQTQWNMLVDKAGACCGVGVIIVLNSGKIFIMGERFLFAVGDSTIITEMKCPLVAYQDGSTATSGKKFDDANASTIVIKGEWMKSLVEFTGSINELIPYIV